jgi:1-aminocyclopropane-1-carboxylate deaminase/D-cysteine desulfhydrase-like pyridoxal-dependent ACC family enzyme
LAYVLDPTNAIEQIKRKVTAAEIGGAAIQSGLKTGMTRAEELAAAGITKQQAQQGFQTVAEVAPRGGQLAAIYGESPYTQTTAEQEVFGLAGSTEAAKQRKKLTQLETAAFSASAGAGAIARDRAGAF